MSPGPASVRSNGCSITRISIRDGASCTTHVNARESDLLPRSGAVAGLCPITEANLGDGVFPADAYLRAGGRFGVGTDSNVLIDAPGELRALEYAQRLSHRARNVLAVAEGQSTGRTLFDVAHSGGAQALGVFEVGLREAANADIVSLDAGDASLASNRASSAPGICRARRSLLAGGAMPSSTAGYSQGPGSIVSGGEVASSSRGGDTLPGKGYASAIAALS